MKYLLRKIFFSFFLFILVSCNSDYTVGKKRGYFKIDFPEKKYKEFDQPGYPYSFEYPVYSQLSGTRLFLKPLLKTLGGSILIFRNSQQEFI